MKPVVSAIRHQVTDIILYGRVTESSVAVCRILVGSAARQSMNTTLAGTVHPALSEVTRLLIRYLDGRIVDFSSVNIDAGTGTPFRSAVLSKARQIPYGAAWSYSELARKAGFSRAVRAAASVMRNNPLPIIIPCHRVIRIDGASGAYAGDRTGEDAALKKTLLQLEQSSLKKRSS